jgi:hypothetical protein
LLIKFHVEFCFQTIKLLEIVIAVGKSDIVPTTNNATMIHILKKNPKLNKIMKKPVSNHTQLRDQ